MTVTFDPLTAPARRWSGTDFRVAGLGLAALIAWEWLGWDRPIAALFGGTQGFAWREHWLTSGLAHQGGRWLGWGVLTLLLVNTVRPLVAGPSLAERRYWLAATLIGLLAVPGLKRLSSTSCPWDLREFGGSAPYVPHWLPGVSDGGPGHCFPSGHAVAAFAFFSLWFLWRDHQPGWARASLAGVTVVGTLFGLAQLARGAHFPSHTFWSAWCCWSVCTVMAHLPCAPTRAQTPTLSTPTTQ
jgi:membrane-associated PAP2 superfamily phosphatase